MTTDMSDAAAMMGRRGGKKKVPKGLATMDPEEAKRIRSMGGKARWKNAPKSKAATKKKSAK
jgi:hypothetical protein